MTKKIFAAVLVLLISVPLAVTAMSDVDKIEPQSIPLGGSLTPDYQTVYNYDPEAIFTGEWGGGQESQYKVKINYGDGSGTSSYTTTKTTMIFRNEYDADASSGTTWTARLTVKNGTESISDTAVVQIH